MFEGELSIKGKVWPETLGDIMVVNY